MTPEGDALHQFVSPERVVKASQRVDREMAYAEKAGTHVWMAMASYFLSDDVARTMATGRGQATPTLDTENLALVVAGCFRCEEPLRAGLVGRRCPGEPT